MRELNQLLISTQIVVLGHLIQSLNRQLWLWYRPAAATPIQLLAWELQLCRGCGHKKTKKKKKTLLSFPSWRYYKFTSDSFALNIARGKYLFSNFCQENKPCEI